METKAAAGPKFVIGVVCMLMGMATVCLILACAVLVILTSQRNDTSSFPLITAALGALAVLFWTLGWRLTQGLPLWVPALRWPAGTFLLVAAAILWIAGLHDSDVPLWPAILLGAGGVAVFLSWTVPVSRA